MSFNDALFIQAMHSQQEWLELATDEYSDWWQFERNQHNWVCMPKPLIERK